MSPPPFACVPHTQSYHGAQIFGVLSVTRAVSLSTLALAASGGGSLAIVTMGLKLPSAAASACTPAQAPPEGPRSDREICDITDVRPANRSTSNCIGVGTS